MLIKPDYKPKEPVVTAEPGDIFELKANVIKDGYRYAIVLRDKAIDRDVSFPGGYCVLVLGCKAAKLAPWNSKRLVSGKFFVKKLTPGESITLVQE